MELFSYTFEIYEVAIIAFVGICIGMSKTGVHGAGMVAVPLLAMVFGGQRSAGVMLPMLCLADVMGVWYYHRHASWPHLKKMFPWAAVGTIAGTWIGGVINDEIFKMVMGGIVLLSIVIMIWMERSEQKEIPDYYWFAALTGVGAGFTSMIGNLAGAVTAIYLLSMRLPKNGFIGTSAWFFLVINLFKIPFHIFFWKSISWNSFLLDLSTIPLILIGGWLGIIVVKNLKEKTYRWFIIATTLVAALIMIFS